MSSANISKKRKFVADGVFYAELDEFLTRELGEDGYSGCEVRVTPIRTEIIIRATRTQNVLGEKNRRIRELTGLVQRRFNFDGNVELYAERVQNRAMCAVAQAESLKFKLAGGLPVRRACYGVLRYIMENGAKGCEIIVSGKLRGQRAKAMKFKDGYMIKSGFASGKYVDKAVRHLKLKQGTLGIRVDIMLPHDPSGKDGVALPLSDVITIREPKEEQVVTQPTGIPKEPVPQQQVAYGSQPAQVQMPVQQQPPPQQPQETAVMFTVSHQKALTPSNKLRLQNNNAQPRLTRSNSLPSLSPRDHRLQPHKGDLLDKTKGMLDEYSSTFSRLYCESQTISEHTSSVYKRMDRCKAEANKIAASQFER